MSLSVPCIHSFCGVCTCTSAQMESTPGIYRWIPAVLRGQLRETWASAVFPGAVQSITMAQQCVFIASRDEAQKKAWLRAISQKNCRIYSSFEGKALQFCFIGGRNFLSCELQQLLWAATTRNEPFPDNQSTAITNVWISQQAVISVDQSGCAIHLYTDSYIFAAASTNGIFTFYLI